MSVKIDDCAVISNGGSILLSSVPRLSPDDFRETVLGSVSNGNRVSALFGVPGARNEGVYLYAVLADDEQSVLRATRTLVGNGRFRSLASDCPQVQLFEREIAEQFGLVPEGHPWFKPVRYVRSRTGADAWGRRPEDPLLPAVGDFYRVEGESVHEVAVGPVHAGIIEPGHFRFQCHGEHVFHLEIALGYQHRGVEEAMIGGPSKRSLHYMETLAGDTTIAHASAYALAVEALSGSRPPARAQMIRGIALELERLANHTGDLGALSGDVAFLPTASYCGRIRGDFLNMTALLCGNRFGRGLVRPGGVGYDLDARRMHDLLVRLDAAEKDVTNAVDLLWNAQSVMARFEDTGRLSSGVAVELGLVGPAARASGLVRDIRFNHPAGIYRMVQLPVSTCESGDVFARAFVRKLEIQRSIAFIREQLHTVPSGLVLASSGGIRPDSLSVALQEGWRGEVCHVAVTDAEGRFAAYKVVDPSFHNWQGLAYALRDQEISDFPLCNKSFNLSYCGHDL